MIGRNDFLSLIIPTWAENETENDGGRGAGAGEQRTSGPQKIANSLFEIADSCQQFLSKFCNVLSTF